MEKSWQVLEPDPEAVDKIAEAQNLDPLLAKCMLNRNLRELSDIETFLKPDAYEPPDPMLIPDMEKAVERIINAIEKGERICIYGDYDADGVTAIAILTQGIRELSGDAFYYIPDRFFEGVGLNSNRLEILLQEEQVGLVITVDTGVRAFEEMEHARGLGLDIIITDHHTPDVSQPKAYALLNPKLKNSEYPFENLCGAGVALKMIQALDQRFPNRLNLNKYTQIAAIGTIADMVPLRDENRWIVVQGLRAMNEEESGPIRTLLRKVGIRGHVTALDISYKIAPRINAPGRLGDPDTAIAFFDCEDARKTQSIVDIMDGMNTVRQMLERELQEKMDYQLKHAIRSVVPSFILVAGRHWHRGILGIMACKLMRRYNRPACVMSFDDETAHGSIRSGSGVNLIEAMHQIAPLMSSFGGHPEAAGVTMPVTNVSQFKARMNEILGESIRSETPDRGFTIDAVINWADLCDGLFENIRRLAPFGIGNASPVFLSDNLILETELIRKGPWFHFEASDGNITRKCTYYHPNEIAIELERFDSVDIVYTLAPYRDEYQVQVIQLTPS